MMHFVTDKHVIKDNLFPVPPLFDLIQRESGTDWKEMYKVFNMGHRMEIYVAPEDAARVIEISESMGIRPTSSDAWRMLRPICSPSSRIRAHSSINRLLKARHHA